MRKFQLLGALHLVALLAAGGVQWLSRPAQALAPQARPAVKAATGHAWFDGMKPYCNPVEAGVMVPRNPPPDDADGWGYAAACYALAGKIDRADQILAGIEGSRGRHRAAGIVFRVGHPVADAGDDDAAGPIMRLVVKYQPSNFMALYHAGMSEYILGDHALAREHLERFLRLYERNDGWRRNALEVLARIEKGGVAP